MTSGITFWRWSMYLQHIWGVMVLQNVLMPSFSSGLLLGFCFVPQEIFIQPHTFNWVQIWAFCQALPSINSVFLKEGLNVPTGLFGIFILVQSVPIRIHLRKEWTREADRMSPYLVTIPCCCHDLSELCGTSLWNSCPHVNLCLYIHILQLSLSILLLKGLSPVAL